MQSFLQRKPITVQVVSHVNYEDILRDARELTRPGSTDRPADLLKLDAPIGDLACVVLVFDAPIIVREVVTSLRDVAVWSQSTRVLNLDVWDVPESISAVTESNLKQLWDEFQTQILHGVPQDQARMNLPVCHMSKFLVRISIRTLVKLLRYFEKLAEIQRMNVEVLAVFNETITQLWACLLDSLHGEEEPQAFADGLMRSINVVNILHPVTEDVGEIVGEDFISVHTMMPLAMRAQVIRHRMFQVTDNMIDLISCCNLSNPISTLLRVRITASTVVWYEVARTRNCWLAQGELWAPILEKVNGAFGKLGRTAPMPCDHGVCVYHAECMKRVQGEEPGLPCPRHIVLRSKMGDEEPILKVRSLYHDLIEDSGADAVGELLEEYANQSLRPSSYWAPNIAKAVELINKTEE